MSERDDAFDRMLRGAREAVEHEIESNIPEPDIVDVVVRAHEKGPAAVTPRHVREAGSLARVIPARSNMGPHEGSTNDRHYAVLIADTVSEVERLVQRRRLAAIGRCPPIPSEKRSRGRLWGGGAVLGMAAVALFAWLSPRLQSSTEASTPTEAAFVEKAEVEDHWAEHHGYRVIAPVRPTCAGACEGSMGTDAIAPDGGGPKASARGTERTPAAGRKPSVRDRIGELDQRAQQLWKDGDVRGAAALFQEIIHIGGRHPLVEAAYSDLFAIVHPTSTVRRRKQLWRRYLARFPHGRFADDAQAGLCDGLEGTRKIECWREYLVRHPRGTYRAVAMGVLSNSQGEQP